MLRGPRAAGGAVVRGKALSSPPGTRSAAAAAARRPSGPRRRCRAAAPASAAASAADAAGLDWSKPPPPGKRERRAENIDAGGFWVDTACISCRVCRKMVPSVFGKVGGRSAVLRAPETDEERVAAYGALLSCPTFSIHTDGRPDGALLRAARDAFPLPAFPGAERVFFLGFADLAAIATSSYLVKRARPPSGSGGGGDVLFDAPRFAGPVVDALVRECGPQGPAFFVLSHRDDIGEHQRWAERFPGMRRVVHEREAAAVASLGACEVILRGEGPWRLPDGAEDVLILLTPGHTSGSITLLYAPEQVALTGDHLDGAPPPAEFGVVPPPPPSPDDRQDLHAFRDYCWGSWDEQLASVAKLSGRGGIRRVLPGHGSPALFGSGGHFDAAVERLLASELPGGAAAAKELLSAAHEALKREPAPQVAVAAAAAAVAAGVPIVGR
jgi:glyoxylase-like metal-dependent hydrolase (beta-lactamase superfamily II)/ferredoxin